MDSPFFSVLIPAYNAAEFLQFTLNSVYRQSFADFEIIVVDDGSTDNTLEILRGQTDNRLRFFTQPNSGVSVTRNRAIREGRGKYVALLDGDDAWSEDHLELAARFFRLYPEYVWYLSQAPRCTDISEKDLLRPSNSRGVYTAVNWFLEGVHIPMCSSCVLKRSALPEGDFFPVGIKMYEDNVAFCRLAMLHPMIGFLDSPTARYRIWGGSATDRFEQSRRGQSGVELNALMAQQEMHQSSDCLPEARLFFRYFSYHNWWLRVRAHSMLTWIAEIKLREPVTGKWLTRWLVLFACLSDIFYRIMGKAVRLRYNAVVKEMAREAARQRVILGTSAPTGGE